LSKIDARKGRVVELRYLGGLTVDETAEVLQISPETVMRDWKMAETWLLRKIVDKGSKRFFPSRDRQEATTVRSGLWQKLGRRCNAGFASGAERRNILMRIEKIVRQGREFAVLPMDKLKKLMDNADMLADVKAYDAAKARIERGEDELIPLEITERRLAGENTVKIWREYRALTPEDLAKKSRVSRPMIAAIETKRKKGGIATLKKLAGALKVDLDHLVTANAYNGAGKKWKNRSGAPHR
jgi:DNA-binding XRE family transcriptional regulator